MINQELKKIHMKLIIRKEKVQDIPNVSALIMTAFKNESQVILTDILRQKQNINDRLSIVAEVNGRVAAHVLFSKIKILTEYSCVDTLWLEPICVDPRFQKKGIGRTLVHKGLEIGRCMGYNSVFVIGSFNYYSKFGFREAKQFEIESTLKLPNECFLAMELFENALKYTRGGKILFPPELYD